MSLSSVTPAVFVLDVDGVLTDGRFYYTQEGKVAKAFGPDDNDALGMLRPHVPVQFVTGDRKGLAISQRRIVDDMKFPLELVSTVKRVEWIRERWPLDRVIYMGDGIFDHLVFRQVYYSIAPADADPTARDSASYVTQRSGGKRAVAEACLHLLGKFFKTGDGMETPKPGTDLPVGEWTV